MLALIIAALAAQPAGADAGTNWEMMTQESSVTVLIDPASISRDGDMVRVRVKTVDDRADARFGFMIVRMVVDCPGRRDAIEAAAAYSRQGQLTGSRENEPGEALQWVPTEAGDVSDSINRRVCGGAGAAL